MKLWNDVHDHQGGWNYGRVTAHHDDWKGDPREPRLGHISYSQNNHTRKISIMMIETHPDHRRKGVATAMLNHLKKSYPKHKIEYGGRSDDGAKFLRAYHMKKNLSEMTFMDRVKARAAGLMQKNAVERAKHADRERRFHGEVRQEGEKATQDATKGDHWPPKGLRKFKYERGVEKADTHGRAWENDIRTRNAARNTALKYREKARMYLQRDADSKKKP